MNISERLAKNLIRIREEAGLDSDELAMRASVSRAQIESFEAGDLVLSVEEFLQLAQALEVSLDTLTEGVAWRPDKGRAGEFDISDE
jgi:transcriptional regulator with XRE-family HTH domain